jgi:PKD repeat protein
MRRALLILAIVGVWLIPALAAVQNQPPVAIVTVDVTSGPAPLTVCADGSKSYDLDGDRIVMMEWAGVTLEPLGSTRGCHTFEVVGTIDAIFEVYTADGLSGHTHATITVERPYVPPVPVWVVKTRTGLAYCFDGSQSHDYGGPLTYSWNFGDGSPTVDGVAPCHTYDAEVTTIVALSVTNELGLSATKAVTIKTEAGNSPPVAGGGPDRSAFTSDAVYLDGSATADPNGDPIQWWWWNVFDAPPGSTWGLEGADDQNAIFQAHTPGRYLISLIVDDGFATSAPDIITITVADNLPPVAVAMADVTTGAMPLTVHFSATGSRDPEGGPLSYFWVFGTGDDSREAAPTFVYQQPGEYVVYLSVTDERGLSTADTLVITVKPPANHPPVASPSATSVSGNAPLDVGFEAHASDLDMANWSLSLQDTSHPVFRADTPGTYTLTLRVADAFTSSAPETVGIYVGRSPCGNLPPVANAGGDRTARTGDSVHLNGSATDAESEPASSWWWNVFDAPPGSSWGLEGADDQNAIFQAHTPGRYLISLIVDDAFATSAPDIITITVADNLPPGNQPPVANAGGGRSMCVGDTVVLNGTASDPDGDPILSWAWTVDAGSAGDTLTYLWDFGDPGSGAANTSTEANPFHTFTRAGTYTVRLTVSDGEDQASYTLSVLVNPRLAFSVTSASVKWVKKGTLGNVHIEAEFAAPVPTASDMVAVSLDGIPLVAAPFSAFVYDPATHLYAYHDNATVMTLNFETGAVWLHTNKVLLTGFDPSNGVDVQVSLGLLTGIEKLTMAVGGNDQLVYRRQ